MSGSGLTPEQVLQQLVTKVTQLEDQANQAQTRATAAETELQQLRQQQLQQQQEQQQQAQAVAGQLQQVAAGQEEKQAALAREDALLREFNEAKEKVGRSIEQRDAAREELASLQDTLSQTQHKQQLLERSLSKRDAEAALVAAKMDEMRNHKVQVEQELKDAFARLKVFMRRSMCAYS